MLFRRIPFAGALLAVGLLVGSGASAAPIWSDNNSGVTTNLALNSGPYTVNLWMDVDGQTLTGASWLVTATGSITFTAAATCPAGSNCSSTAGFPNQGPQSGNASFATDVTTDFQLATLTINVGAGPGQVIVTGGWDDTDFNTNPTGEFVLVNAIPEPGTLLLLGSGLVGLVVAGRRA